MTTSAKILIVDDAPANLVALDALLDQADYDLIKASSGEEALEYLLHHHDIALILMDVQMPELNGFETVKIIKQNRLCEQIPVIFLTALSKESQYVQQGYRVGAVDYLTKPYDPTILRAKVASFVMLYRIQEELREEIVQRKHAEHALRLASQAIENTIEGIIITDQKGTMLSVNKAFERVTGYSEKEAIGNNPSMLQSGRQNQAFYQQLWKDVKENGSWSGKVWNRRKNGEIYPEHLSITAIQNRAGTTINFVGVFSDISKELSLEENLLQSQKMEAIGTLVGGIAHDFNNMLSGMTGHLYLARKKTDPSSDIAIHLEQIDKLCALSATMIAQLLTFARKGLVNMQNLSLRVLVNEVLMLARVTIPENISLQHTLQGDNPLMVHGDATQLQQVMVNLINNARDAVADTPDPMIDVQITATSAANPWLQKQETIEGKHFVHITVHDNGSGIPQQNLSQIFEPFFTTKEAGKGTGLGLAMCYGAMQSHHGVLDVESTVGRGTTFHLFLPLVEDSQPREADKTSTVMDSDIAQGELILLADDAINVREPCAEFLNDLGYTVLEAEDGKQAMELFAQHKDQVVLALLDVVMPYIGGPPLAEKLREINPNLPVIFVTGYDRNRVIDPKHPMENCEVLTKPYQYPALGALISKFLQKEA